MDHLDAHRLIYTSGPEGAAMVAVCHGNTDDHCCYVNGVRCRYLEENTVPERRWACGLRRRLGSWEAVHADPGYQEHVQAVWDALGTRPDGTPVIESCGAFPSPGILCGTCGQVGTEVEIG